MSDIINKENILEHAKKLAAEGRFDRATAEYEKLLQLDPDDLRIKIKIAELHVKRKQIQDAIRIYTEVAASYADGGFYLKAVTVLKSILRLNPSLIDINIALAELYEKMGLLRDALYQYQIVVTSYERKNDSDGMIKIREKMALLDPDNIEMKIRLAEAYQLVGQEDKSMDLYESMIESVKKIGKNDLLIEIYGKVLSHRPDRIEYFKDLCRIIYRRGEWKEIIRRMDGAKELVSDDTELLAMQADVYARLNQIESAKKKYRELAELFIDHGSPEDAIDAYANILVLSPDNEEDIASDVEVIYDGAMDAVREKVEQKRKKIADDEARRELENNSDKDEAEENGPQKNREAQQAKSLRDSALQAASGDYASQERDADAAYELGRMYAQTGLTDEAKLELGKAILSYRRLAAAGRANPKILARIEELSAVEDATDAKQVQPSFETTAVSAQEKVRPSKSAAKSGGQEKTEQPKAAPKKPATKNAVQNKKSQSEPKKNESLSSAKKKISFI